MANRGVNAIGKIQWRGFGRQIDHMSFGCKHVYPIGCTIPINQLFDMVFLDFLVPFQNLPQPGDFFFVAAVGGPGIGTFIAPVRTDAQFSFIIHFMGPNLNFQHLAPRTNYGCVQGSIAIFLGEGNIIIELIGNIAPMSMHDTQYGVTVRYRGHQDSHCTNVINLRKANILALHLFPDAVYMFCTASDLCLYVCFFQLRMERIDHLVDIVLTIHTTFIEQSCDLFILLWLQIAKRQIFQLPFELANTESVR